MIAHAVAVATVRAFAARSGAERVVALLDEGEEAPTTMVEWRAGEPLELTVGGVTEAIEDDPGVPPLDVGAVHAVPPSALDVDPGQGELSAPLGAVARLAEAVLALATAFGGRSVATAEFATREPGVELTIAARPGEPIVASLGGEPYAFPEDWP